jgi:hypothetical protein
LTTKSEGNGCGDGDAIVERKVAAQRTQQKWMRRQPSSLPNMFDGGTLSV